MFRDILEKIKIKSLKPPEIKIESEDSLNKAQESFESAQEVLERINRIVAEIRNDLKAERKGIPQDVNKIKIEIRKKQYELNQIQRKIEKLKSRSKNHKIAIDQWKGWYEGITEVGDETEEREKLLHEINRRATEIAKIEEEIGNSHPIETKIKEEIDKLNFKLQVFEQDQFDDPIDQDPRLLNLIKQQQEARNSLESAQKELKNLKKKQKQKTGRGK